MHINMFMLLDKPLQHTQTYNIDMFYVYNIIIYTDMLEGMNRLRTTSGVSGVVSRYLYSVTHYFVIFWQYFWGSFNYIYLQSSILQFCCVRSSAYYQNPIMLVASSDGYSFHQNQIKENHKL